MADDIHRWSDELARDPSSLVFLQLADALRKEGQLELAFKVAVRGLERHPQHAGAHDLVARIAVDRADFSRAAAEWEAVLRLEPEHLGAMKGLGYISFHQGRLDVAEQYLERAAAEGAGQEVATALANVRRSSGATRMPVSEPGDSSGTTDAVGSVPADPERLFADLLRDDGQTALLLDGSGYVLAGVYLDSDGSDVGQNVGAQLSGVSEEVRRAARHLDLGAWKSMVFETHAAVVAMAPSEDDGLVVVAASRATPLGLLRRVLERCVERAAAWLPGGGQKPPAEGDSGVEPA